jgi:two-component system, chemotaxis family, protein-glutamate methylesterase/glutaminase
MEIPVKKIRVLVVDDSALMRRVICNILEEDPNFCVVGTAVDGLDAIEKLHALQPDVLTMDVEMPKLDGLQALGYIMSERPTPVVMLSAYTPGGADITLKALEFGATDFIQKPSGSISLDLAQIRDELVAKVKVAAGIDLKRLPFIAREDKNKVIKKKELDLPVKSLVLMACSTGGPRALAAILPLLPEDFPVPILIVQHMSQGFTRSLAQRLDRDSKIRVKEAENGEVIKCGTAYLAPGDWHMLVEKFKNQHRISLNQRPPLLGVRPSADLLFESAVESFGSKILGVILTGMGRDASKGARLLKEHQGRCLAQDEASSVVFGMPKAAWETNAVEKMVPLKDMAATIVEYKP